jgi:predicted dehydrogenase
MIRYAVVGRGWRAQFFLRLAATMPERFTVTGVVTRDAEGGREVESQFGVASFRSLDDLLRSKRPDFVVTCVPRDINPGFVEEAVAAKLAVLSETPPATDLDGLRSLWSRVGSNGLVQVAEQYLLLPDHAARRAVVEHGTIGPATSVHVCSTHDYHAVSMIRGLLGMRFETATVRASQFTAALSDPLSPAGWSGDDKPIKRTTTVATIDFGDRMGLYDFTDNQWWNPLRTRRIVIRGERGEIVDDRVVRLLDARTPIESQLIRRQTGRDLNLEGADLDHITFDGAVVYRNEFNGARLSDEDIAISTLLDRMGRWRRGEGDAPYPLADACQDHLIALALAESVKSGAPVTTTTEPWAAAG